MRLAIYGAGAIGTVLGAYLTRAGISIDLVNHNVAHVAALKNGGAKVVGTVDFVQPVSALLPEAIEGVYDVVFLMTKQLDNRRTVQAIVPHLATDGVICTMQNGLPEPSVAAIIGVERTYGCAVGWGATLLRPGVCELTSEPTHEALAFSLGTMSGRRDEKLDTIAAVLGKMGKVTIEANFMGARWAKLLVNAAFSGLSTCFGCTFGEVAANRRSRLVAQRIIKETIETARRSGVKIEPIQGKDVVKLLDYHNAFKRRLSYMIIPLAIKKHRLIRASMLQDVERGKKTEIDAINGAVAEQAARIGFPTPMNDLVVRIVKDIEAGTASPGWQNLARFETLLHHR